MERAGAEFGEVQKTKGELLLELIGYEHLRGQPLGTNSDGKLLFCEEFDELCGPDGEAQLDRLLQFDPNNPEDEPFIDAARAVFDERLSRHVAQA